MPGRTLIAALLVVAAACSQQAGGESVSKRDGSGDPPADAKAAPSGARAGSQAAGGRGESQTVSLAASDVAEVVRAPIERAYPITGNLDPIERVEVRARIEGDLLDVNVREGQHVRRGQLLARFDALDVTSDARSAEADLAAAKSTVGTAQWTLDQTRELFREGAVAEQDVRSDEEQLAAAKARQAAAEARVRATSTMLEATRVVAPLAGTIETRAVAPGEHVARGAQLFSLVRTDVLELEAAVSSRAAADVRPGQTVRFVADGRPFEGKVARVSPTVQAGSRTLAVYVEVPNAQGTLKGGTFASGRVVGERVENSLVVPLPAIRQAPRTGEPFVWRIRGGTLERAPVQVGITDDAADRVQITSGLQAGDRVVVGNVGLLGEGASVQILGTEPNTPQH